MEITIELEWFWVDEKLPENTDDVLVTDGYAVRPGWYFEPDNFWVSDFEVIAWARMIPFPNYDEFLKHNGASE